MTTQPSVLFVCVKNGGKSQMAAGLMRHVAGTAIRVHSAGTRPGSSLNAESVAALDELGADLTGEHPKPIATELLDAVDRVVLIGNEVQLEEVGSAPVERWVTDEPSERGITGMERMRLIREDLAARVAALYEELLATQLGEQQ
ncbi:low molecular weight phosphatase family protein [Bogoriella caseilytica]|uniref:Arsenate-mycothiol transferase n=1 Tax=Bogoriella caseilytica TaxID=56055 RepID=A0A3N2BC00_9MICO|nr:low molecular weight phosphatase family protein [Bogoriella caseilytica]ROR72781.1 arsenate-mycothiol transferase [Bogoriella caseilytica]